MNAIHRSHYRIRFASAASDVLDAQKLRHKAFFENRSRAHPRPDGLDRDSFDAACRHVLIEEESSGELVACFRLLPLPSGREIGQSYTAQFYDLSALCGYPAPVIEMGRFCMRPGWRDPVVLRLAWGAVANAVDAWEAGLLFGCSSFEGASRESHQMALTLLAARYLAPERWMPRIKAPQVIPYAAGLAGAADIPVCDARDARDAFAAIPPLLRFYLGLGGWVSDHAVIDTDLDTLHVFTGLEIESIPPQRARRLREVLPPATNPPIPTRSPLAELTNSA